MIFGLFDSWFEVIAFGSTLLVTFLLNLCVWSGFLILPGIALWDAAKNSGAVL